LKLETLDQKHEPYIECSASKHQVDCRGLKRPRNDGKPCCILVLVIMKELTKKPVIASEARQSIYTAYKYSATINGLNRIIFKNPVTCECGAKQSIAKHRLKFQLLIIVA